ncbi:hypothetical protein [Salinispira pacifica]|uniref:Uncharacterized protein n=1 Tax=Salinispira pacifica TaxID=1307761 RepID=V5WK02_9SPIO|nr:hypothetical protein [Salinispira pacifica]AHC16132.1 hypothetical protein L21SP2_2782 [Salinispira pacifica]
MKRVLMLVLLVSLALGGITAQSAEDADDSRERDMSLARFIRSNNIHRIGGYTSLGLMTATGVTGMLGWEGHPYLGYASLGSAALSSIAGTIAYSDRIDRVWPHMLFNALGVSGLFLNAFILEPGSIEHRLSGAAALGSFAAGYISIILITR